MDSARAAHRLVCATGRPLQPTHCLPVATLFEVSGLTFSKFDMLERERTSLLQCTQHAKLNSKDLTWAQTAKRRKVQNLISKSWIRLRSKDHWLLCFALERATQVTSPSNNTSFTMLNTMSRSGVSTRSSFSGRNAAQTSSVATTRRGRVNVQQVSAIKDGATLDRPLRVAVIGGEIVVCCINVSHQVSSFAGSPSPDMSLH